MPLTDYAERPKAKTKVDAILEQDTEDTRTLDKWLRDLDIPDREIERRLREYSKAEGVDLTVADSTIRRWREINT